MKGQKISPRFEETSIDLSSNLAQIVVGVRRSGKSTLCHKVLLDSGIEYGYINFDDERLSGIKASDLDKLLEAAYVIYGDFTHLFIDEVQNISEWFLFVNRLLRQGIHLIITGSNAKLLSSELSTHLTGRYNQIELFPFSFQEFCQLYEIETNNYSTKGRALLRRAFDNYLRNGGFPELAKINNTKRYILSLFEAIVTRDIQQRFRVRYKDALKKIANNLIDNFAREIVPSRIAKQFEIASVHTVENYIDYLKQAYLIVTLHKFSHKSKERLRNEKCYLVDLAFASERENAFVGEDLGWRIENIVYLELIRRHKKLGREIFYFKKGYEIDFVVCNGNKAVELIQVSYSLENEKTKKREINALAKGSAELNCTKLTLLTLDDGEIINFENGLQVEVKNLLSWLSLND